MNTLADYQNQIQTFWSPVFVKTLREKSLLPGLVSKDYDGEIKKGGDTVTVTQILDSDADIIDIDKTATNGSASTFQTSKLETSKISIVANKRIVKAFEFEDLVDIQSLIEGKSPEVMEKMQNAISRKLNRYLRSLFAPSSSSPDHVINSVSAFSSTTLKTLRANAGAAKWPEEDPWYLLLDPTYHSDPIDDSKLASMDYGAGDQPLVQGRFATKRAGFTILEDNSMDSKTGLAFHKDAVHLVLQRAPTVKISDLHSNKQFGYLVSIDMIFGAQTGFNHELLCQTIQST